MSQLLISYLKIGSSTATIYINNAHAYIHVPNFTCTPQCCFFFMKIQGKHKSLDLIPKIRYSTVVVKTL